jgi:CRP-like cAMP-binding protein
LIESATLENGAVISDKGIASLALGQQNYGVTVREMTSAFCVFPNKGVHNKTRTYLYVYDSLGETVLSNDAESNTLLRVLSVGDVFGVAGLLSGYTDISRIIVKSGKLSVISIPKEEILSLISDDPGFARKYVSLLEQKIVFLNRRILAFTAGTCERRLATFLNSVSSEEQFEVGPIAFSSLAMQLNMGRASFYRALDAFEKDGLIRRETKTLYVLSRSKLKEKYLK